MQIMSINVNNDDFINVNVGINANNVINVNPILYAISLRRDYIKSFNRDTIVLVEKFSLYCKTTDNLSRYNHMYHVTQNMVLPLWRSTASVAQPLLACIFSKNLKA